MKILVIANTRVESLFTSNSKHEIIFCQASEALDLFIEKKPEVVMAFAECQTTEFAEAREAFEDIKLSSPSDNLFVRLGFLPEKKTADEVYIRLPATLEDESLNKIIFAYFTK